MKKILWFFVLIISVFAFSCNNTDSPQPVYSSGYEYYPLEVGQYRIYKVTDIVYKHNIPTTTHSQIKERITETFLDQTNTLNYKIVRSVRENENAAWVDDSVMVVTKSVTNVILTRDNTKYVKFVFPVKEDKTWVADAYNNRVISNDTYPLNKEHYRYENIDKPFSLEGKTFDKTVTVIQGKPSNNLIKLDDRKEVYAEGIGRVYRQFNRVVYCLDSESKSCPYGTAFKLDGHERHELLIDYGKE